MLKVVTAIYNFRHKIVATIGDSLLIVQQYLVQRQCEKPYTGGANH